MKRKNAKWTIPLVLLLCAFAVSAFQAKDRYFEIAKNLDIFASLFREVNNFYVDEINPAQLIEKGIEGMLESLDPYTNYIAEEDIEDYRTMTTGRYGGIGAVVGDREGRILILMPYEGYPAFTSGIKIGDEIIKVDGQDVKGKSTSDISKLLKGQAGTSVKLTVLRYGSDKPLELDILREKIKVDNIAYKGMLAPEVGYLHLTDFTSGAANEVKNAVLELKEKGAKKLVVDLRGNPGGLLHEAVKICNLFIPKGSEVVTTKGKMTEWNKTYKALDVSLDTDIPVVVLVNEMSASAAEIVAGVLQDYDRGVLVGHRTFGKGLVQATRPLSYNAQLKVTTAKYYTPSGRCIQAIDYAIKDKEGNVTTIPDSLLVAFKTSKGRVVYDGRGILPDIETEKITHAPITNTLAIKNLLFDYATKYAHEHPAIAPADKFKLTDDEYALFVKWLENKEYDYTTKVEATIEELVKQSKQEKYYERIKGSIQSLKDEVYHNKNSDLQEFKAEIKEMLEVEIVSRYYYQRGIMEASFDNDPEIISALNILKDAGRYNEVFKVKN